MSLRRTASLFVSLVASVALSAAQLGEFVIALPAPWKVSSSDSMKVVAAAPNGAELRFSTYQIKGGTKDPEGNRAARNVKEAAFASAAKLVASGAMVEQMHPTEKALLRARLYEALYTSSDARRYLAMYVLSGGSSVVVATVEGDAREIKQILGVRSALIAAGGGTPSN